MRLYTFDKTDDIPDKREMVYNTYFPLQKSIVECLQPQTFSYEL